MFGGDSGSSSPSILPTFQDESAFAQCCPNLSYQQRIYGYLGCMISGWVLSFLGTIVLIGGPTTTNISIFAILYVFGNIIGEYFTGVLLLLYINPIYWSLSLSCISIGIHWIFARPKEAMSENVGSLSSLYDCILSRNDFACIHSSHLKAKYICGSLFTIRGDISGYLVLSIIHPIRP